MGSPYSGSLVLVCGIYNYYGMQRWSRKISRYVDTEVISKCVYVEGLLLDMFICNNNNYTCTLIAPVRIQIEIPERVEESARDRRDDKR